MTAGFSFTHKNQRISDSHFGSGYLAEFSRVLEEYGGRHVRAMLEWGSGLSSLMLDHYAAQWDCALFVTIDTDAEYQASVFRDRTMHRSFVARSINEIGPRRGQTDQELNYATLPFAFARPFDIIFIDGRRRVECAYIAALLATVDGVVIMHDYRRSRYQPVLGLFDILEDGKQFRVMQVRPAVAAALQPGRERALGYMDALRTLNPRAL